ncbi:hypothetical protein B0H16DRAFT_1480678 [Mycena metata]|uniref:Uncharacterized protein n=1 Tax=Mycena metata TaxID=1033252 RepID=A0AAD7H265_9AGAR|nr:hypothetical protein B0H16DRAFT_1480678 [Mycena metata]
MPMPEASQPQIRRRGTLQHHRSILMAEETLSTGFMLHCSFSLGAGSTGGNYSEFALSIEFPCLNILFSHSSKPWLNVTQHNYLQGFRTTAIRTSHFHFLGGAKPANWLAKPTNWLASRSAGLGLGLAPKSKPKPETSQFARAQANLASQKVNSRTESANCEPVHAMQVESSATQQKKIVGVEPSPFILFLIPPLYQRSTAPPEQYCWCFVLLDVGGQRHRTWSTASAGVYCLLPPRARKQANRTWCAAHYTGVRLPAFEFMVGWSALHSCGGQQENVKAAGDSIHYSKLQRFYWDRRSLFTLAPNFPSQVFVAAVHSNPRFKPLDQL